MLYQSSTGVNLILQGKIIEMKENLRRHSSQGQHAMMCIYGISLAAQVLFLLYRYINEGQPVTKEGKARIKWACRRGMLELDVIIMPFFDDCFDDLTASQEQEFVALLECQDPDLFMWLMGKGNSSDPGIQRITQKIIEHNRSKLR